MLTFATAFVVGALLARRVARGRSHHRPRAIKLLLQLPAPPPELRDFAAHGWATYGGDCAWCGRVWTDCSAEVLTTGRCRKPATDAWWEERFRETARKKARGRGVDEVTIQRLHRTAEGRIELARIGGYEDGYTRPVPMPIPGDGVERLGW